MTRYRQNGVSRLFEDKTNWYALSREEFLRHIDEKKEALLKKEKGGGRSAE